MSCFLKNYLFKFKLKTNKIYASVVRKIISFSLWAKILFPCSQIVVLVLSYNNKIWKMFSENKTQYLSIYKS